MGIKMKKMNRGLIINWVLLAILIAFAILIVLMLYYALYAINYPSQVLIAVKQKSNGTVILWSEYTMIYNGRQGQVLQLNGSYYNIEKELSNVKFKIDGKIAEVKEIKPVVEDFGPFVGITQLGNPDIVYKAILKYK